MRDLTEEELKLAPEWSTHYYVFTNGGVMFESEDLYVRLCGISGRLGDEQCNKDYGVGGVPMPFDITEHEFGDTVGFVELDDGVLTLSCTGLNYIELHKDDAIAIAKTLGVTGEDLC